MALRRCHNCGKLVDALGNACSNCGHHRKTPPYLLYAGLVVALGGIFALVQANTRPPASLQTHAAPSPSSSTSSAALALTPAETPTPSPSPTATPIGQQWHYSADEDPMGRGTTYVAWVSSSNTVEFSFPYQGAQRATLMLRSHPRYGKDIIFSIEKGQILCRSYKPCNVLVRFDDEQANSYSAVGPDDNSSTHIFLQGYSRFMAKLVKAKRIRISVTVYQQGDPVFDFDISGLSLERYKGDANYRKERK